VTASEIVCSDEGDSFLIVETHLGSEYLTDVIGSKGTVWQSTMRRYLAVIDKICATGFPFDIWSTHVLYRYYAGKRP